MSETADDPFDFGIGSLAKFSERVRGESSQRLAMGDRDLTFGVHWLDVALGGIFPNDLVLLGAKTGMGKTALSTLIAMANARAGKRVHYFALEAEENEIERRIKYRALVDAVFAKSKMDGYELNYLDWYRGRLEHVTRDVEADVEAELAKAYDSLTTFYRVGDFTADKLKRTFLAIQDETDLIILDHLHYIDTDDSNENRGYKIIVKQIRDAALNIGKPVVVVAHVRKAERRAKLLVPGIEDFHGTSDVPKIATKAIMIAPAPDFAGGDIPAHVWPTFMSIAKCRPEGSRARFTAVTYYDSRRERYHGNYLLGRLKNWGEEFEPMGNLDPTRPRWAKPYQREEQR